MKKWLLAACLAAGCSGDASTQVVTGKLASNAIGVRAVSDGNVITAARVRSDGSFTLSLPAGKQYSLEVMTSTGTVKAIGATSAVVFKVCEPQDPWDMGGVGSGTGMCPPPPPPPCDLSDPTCKPPPPPPPPPGCTPPPPPCDPATDPDCKLPPPPCDPATDASCTLPPPPCADPTDPNTCKDPCMADPSQCGCTSPDGTCWPPPMPPGDCDGSMKPDNPPGDFGCGGSGSS